VPLYYEKRIPELQLINESISEELDDILERAALDSDEEQRFARDFAREYHLSTRDDRLATIAGDIANHFLERGHQGKAMVISVDKATAVKMHDKVKAAWAVEIERLKRAIARSEGAEKDSLEEQLRLTEATDMAVVVSQGQNEEADIAAKGADIRPHRERMVKEDLEMKFKDPDNPLRIVIVTAMWMTGFDVPVLSTLYLDKPMKNHTLMQTIARANRVFPGKAAGEIIDYIGVFRDLEKALAIYASGPDGTELPVANKEALAADLAVKVAEVRSFCTSARMNLDSLIGVSKFQWIVALEDARDKLVVNDLTRNGFLHLADEAARIWKALKPHPAANESGEEMWAIVRLSQAVRSLAGPVDVSVVMDEVEELLERSIGAEPYVIDTDGKQVDLSAIDFDALAKKFAAGKRNTAGQQLRGALERKITEMIRLNPTRVDYAQKLKEMIDRYNSGSANIEEFFEQLKLFAQELNEEEQRAVAEAMTEEELALFDLLTKPEPTLTKDQEAEVKKIARELLERLKNQLLVLDWKKRQQTRAAVQVAIEENLEPLPEAYDKSLWQEKCSRVFEHVFEAYQGDGRSIYGEAA
jgi:type I restriction enzyme R subunit